MENRKLSLDKLVFKVTLYTIVSFTLKILGNFVVCLIVVFVQFSFLLCVGMSVRKTSRLLELDYIILAK